jgi:hypothetical protein
MVHRSSIYSSQSCLQQATLGTARSTRYGLAAHYMKAIVCVAVAASCWSPAAYAYRPFEGTEANTAEEGTFELEIGAGHLRRGSEKSLQLPAVVANWGIAHDTEIVLEGQLDRRLGDSAEQHRTSLDETALSIKHVFRRGTLQKASGPSVAGECGILLPTAYGAPSTGASCAVITSLSGSAGAMHLNGALIRTRERTTNRFVGVIIEGPGAWTVRPVAEIVTQRIPSEARINSVLLGAIWKRSDNLSFDLGLRKGRADGENIAEAKIGLTWSFATGKE